MDLVQRSLEIIQTNQALSGAYLACPTFPTYHYGWFRDGAFCAHALDLFGQEGSAHRFFQWTVEVILRYAGKIHHATCLAQAGRPLADGDTFHARFTAEGYEVPGHWGNHQLDGLGTWLWALERHHGMNPEQPLPAAWEKAVYRIREYLIAMWRLPCSDIWEEHEDQMHSYTLAAVSAGLRSLSVWQGDERARGAADEIQNYLLARAVLDGRLVKSIGNPDVDANLIALAVPYGMIPPQDPRMQATLDCIEHQLIGITGGLRRYPKDRYYGGGEWPVLYAWLGWLYAEAGDMERARGVLRWLEGQANERGELPEQVQECLNYPEEYTPWVKRWGPVASPLLWSHAMYLILHHTLDKNPAYAGGHHGQ
jgi:GH15 family glucan-1,4-alpha-glucosidase